MSFQAFNNSDVKLKIYYKYSTKQGPKKKKKHLLDPNSWIHKL